MKWFQGTYTQRYNGRHRMFGHLFQGRYKALVVDGEAGNYFGVVSTYIHLNPARARLFRIGQERLATYRWSSYPLYLEARRQRPGWLVTERVMGDCSVAISASMTEGRHGRHFFPFYWVTWKLATNHLLFDSYPDQFSAAAMRGEGRTTVASLQFFEPTKTLNSLQVIDRKYLLSTPLTNLDLLLLLTNGNSKEAVLYEVNIATNAGARLDFEHKWGQSDDVLRRRGFSARINKQIGSHLYG